MKLKEKIKLNLDMIMLSKSERNIVDSITDTIKKYEGSFPTEASTTHKPKDLVYDSLMIMDKPTLLHVYSNNHHIKCVVNNWINAYR